MESPFFSRRSLGATLFSTLGATFLSSAALAQDSETFAAAEAEMEFSPNVGSQPDPASERPEVVPEEAATTTPRFHLTLGAAYTSQFYGRGIVTETDGTIIQPYADFSLDLVRDDTFTLSATLGTWDSFHSNKATAGTTDHFNQGWFEHDMYVGVAASIDEWVLEARYFWYTSPSQAFGTIEEFYFTAAFDDAEYLGEWSLQPTAILAFETTNDQADGGLKKGTYFQAGISPGFTFDAGQFKEVELTFPAIIGLSLSNFYEGPNGENDFFGYTTVGVDLAVPLQLDPSWGEWTLTAGVQALLLGDATAAMNNGDSAELIATFGVEASF